MKFIINALAICLLFSPNQVWAAKKIDVYRLPHLFDKPFPLSVAPPAIQILLQQQPERFADVDLDSDQLDQLEASRDKATISACQIMIDQIERKITRADADRKLRDLVGKLTAQYLETLPPDCHEQWLQGVRQVYWRLGAHELVAQQAGLKLSQEAKKTLKSNAAKYHPRGESNYAVALSVLEQLAGRQKAIELIGEEASASRSRRSIAVPDDFDPATLVKNWLAMHRDLQPFRFDVLPKNDVKISKAQRLAHRNLNRQKIWYKHDRDRMFLLGRKTETALPMPGTTVFFTGKVKSVIDGDRFVLESHSYVRFIPEVKSTPRWMAQRDLGQDDFQAYEEELKSLHVPARDIVIRLDSIDAPALDQPYGKQARKALRERILGKYVFCSARRKQLGPLFLAESRIADVFTNLEGLAKRRSVNTEMLDGGKAWYLTPNAIAILPPDDPFTYVAADFGSKGNQKNTARHRAFKTDRQYQRMEFGWMGNQSTPSGQSFKNQTGLWAQESPIAPWNWTSEYRAVRSERAGQPDQIRYVVSEPLPESQFERLALRVCSHLDVNEGLVSFYTDRSKVAEEKWKQAVDRTSRHHVAKVLVENGRVVELKTRAAEKVPVRPARGIPQRRAAGP